MLRSPPLSPWHAAFPSFSMHSLLPAKHQCLNSAPEVSYDFTLATLTNIHAKTPLTNEVTFHMKVSICRNPVQQPWEQICKKSQMPDSGLSAQQPPLLQMPTTISDNPRCQESLQPQLSSAGLGILHRSGEHCKGHTFERRIKFILNICFIEQVWRHSLHSHLHRGLPLTGGKTLGGNCS